MHSTGESVCQKRRFLEHPNNSQTIKALVNISVNLWINVSLLRRSLFCHIQMNTLIYRIKPVNECMKQLILIMIIVSLLSCTKESSNPMVENPCTLDMENYDYSYGIEYDEPDKYLIPGEQSDLDSTFLEEIRVIIGTPEESIAGIKTVCHWFNQNFTFSNAGGSMIGKKTVNELYDSKTFYGCHSAALVISSVLRKFGFPTFLIETASIFWAFEYNKGTAQGFVGHVMTEVYVSDKWILLDNNCTYVEDYDYMNPFISTMAEQGLFAYAKGIDSWDYGVYDESDTHKKMINFAEDIECFKDLFNTVDYYWEN